jgi:hypothetical protein
MERNRFANVSIGTNFSREMPMATRVHDHVELTTQESRQGEGSTRVRWVLRISLGLALIAGLVVYFSFFPL